jgi:pantoate--beta-alanine ligase
VEVIRIPRVMRESSRENLYKGKTIGLVPTMGAIHAGHTRLVKSCREENDVSVVSLFVNPTQFAPGEDLENYPRDLDADMQKLEEAGADTLFLPAAGAVYPEGFSTSVEVKGLSGKLCGAFRPGHFRGVATVVTKLLNMVTPTRAYFGAKDYQQSLVIRRLVQDLNIPVEIAVLPTVREEDGLAMSSRNAYLSADERQAAQAIYRALANAADMVGEGKRDAAEINAFMNETLKKEPLITEVQYAGVYDLETLDDVAVIKNEVLLAVAVKLGNARLIDNMLAKGK